MSFVVDFAAGVNSKLRMICYVVDWIKQSIWTAVCKTIVS